MLPASLSPDALALYNRLRRRGLSDQELLEQLRDPERAELIVDTDRYSLEECVEQVLQMLTEL